MTYNRQRVVNNSAHGKHQIYYSDHYSMKSDTFRKYHNNSNTIYIY